MTSMNAHARVAGALLLLAMAASIIGGTMIQSVTDQPDLVRAVMDGKQTLGFGVVLELVNALAVIGIAVALWKPLKQQSPTLAAGYLSVRTLEAGACSAAAFVPLTMLATQSDSATLSMIAVRATMTDYAVPLYFSIGGILLYITLYRSNLVPKYIAIWGMIAVPAVMLTMVVSVSALQPVLALPIILNEIYLGIYLLVKGFRERGRSS